MSTKKLINKLNRHDHKGKHKKISRIGPEKITKLQTISDNELNQVKKLKKKKKKNIQKSIDKLKELVD